MVRSAVLAAVLMAAVACSSDDEATNPGGTGGGGSAGNAGTGAGGATGGDSGTAGSSSGSCDAPLTTCGGECVNLQANGQHCGLCDRACPMGQACVAGACESVCPGAQKSCGGLCIDTANNNMHCGDCDKPCPAGQLCANGVCDATCPADQKECSGACVNTMTDTSHCGDCDKPCEADEECVKGACRPSCTSQLLSAVFNQWGVSWDGTVRAPSTHGEAKLACEQIGGRLPTATELFRSSAAESGSVGTSADSDETWTLVPHSANRHIVGRLDNGSLNDRSDTSTQPYRCVCPATASGGFSSAKCSGPPGSTCVTTTIGGHSYHIDAGDRARLNKLGASFECSFGSAHLWDANAFTAAYATSAKPNAENYHIADDDFLAKIGEVRGASNPSNVSFGRTDDNNSLTFRCVGTPKDFGAHPNAVPNGFRPGRGTLTADGSDRAAAEWLDAHDTCWAAGGHLASRVELVETVAHGLSGGSGAELWVADQHGKSTGWRVGTLELPANPLAYEYRARWTTRGNGPRPYRCVYYPLDPLYSGPAATACQGGCREFTPGSGTTPRIWVDQEDRPATNFTDAITTCAGVGARLTSARDLAEAIRAGLPNGSGEPLFTTDRGENRFHAVSWTATEPTYNETDGMSQENDSADLAFRCIWTNELR